LFFSVYIFNNIAFAQLLLLVTIAYSFGENTKTVFITICILFPKQLLPSLGHKHVLILNTVLMWY